VILEVSDGLTIHSLHRSALQQ